MKFRRYHGPPPRYRGPVDSPAKTVKEQSLLPFEDRKSAGSHLGVALHHLAGRDDVVVMAIPRGGAIVAAEVARILGAPVDVWLSARIVNSADGTILGAVSEAEGVDVDEQTVNRLRIPFAPLMMDVKRIRDDIEYRTRQYRKEFPRRELAGKTVVVVDDGIASGRTASLTLKGVRNSGAASCILAAPVSPAEATSRARRDGG